MLVEVPKEIKVHEYRLGLTPEAVREYRAARHIVVVETGAGAGIGADGKIYEADGATILATAAEIYSRARMIVNVKAPQPAERVQLRDNQIIFIYLHLAPDTEQTR